MLSVSMRAARRVGRYFIFDEIASGGMASVHVGRLLGSAGFARTVAVKRLHPHLAKDSEFVAMLTDEARLASRIRHPNVAATLDVESDGDELFLVMEYIHGESLAKLVRVLAARAESMPSQIAIGVAIGALLGLEAAHAATTETGLPLGIVHRDVSPQNIIVGLDGVARVLDFGVAKAIGRLQTTREGELKGKASYMSPEQLYGHHVDQRADVYAMAVVLWEMLTGHRLFTADSASETFVQILTAKVDPPSRYNPSVPSAIDALVLRGLSRDAAARFPSALAFASALEKAMPPPASGEVAAWVERTAGDALRARSARVLEIERADIEAGDVLVTGDAGAEWEQTISSSVASPSRHRRRGTYVAVALVPIAIAGAAFGVAHIRDGDTGSSRRARLAAASTAFAPALAESAPEASTSISNAESAVVITASSSAVAPRPSNARATTKSSGHRPKATAPNKNAARCDPPYTIDAAGIHIPKPECE
jgi:eukaryotic-like serine/threonine-protein kinase